MSASTKVTYKSVAGSVWVDSLTKQVLTVANQILALERFGAETEPMTATQGSYRPVTSYSGTTHTGCAAVDLTAFNWQNRIKVLDLLGIVAFHRTPAQGPWPSHIHCATNGMGCGATSLKAQIVAAKNGRDGLAGNRRDPDKGLRSYLWPLAVWEGRTGQLRPLQDTHLYDGPSSTRKQVWATSGGTRVDAIMEVRNAEGNLWFVTDKGLWGFSAKWEPA